MEEMVKSIDALSRDQFRQLVLGAGVGGVQLPLLLPGSSRASVPLAPASTPEDVRTPSQGFRVYECMPQALKPKPRLCAPAAGLHA